jgi:hypothetical protein
MSDRLLSDSNKVTLTPTMKNKFYRDSYATHRESGFLSTRIEQEKCYQDKISSKDAQAFERDLGLANLTS